MGFGVKIHRAGEAETSRPFTLPEVPCTEVPTLITLAALPLALAAQEPRLSVPHTRFVHPSGSR